MYEHARDTFPHEACGVIIGRRGESFSVEVVKCANIQQAMKEKYPEQFVRGADTGYFMDPRDVRNAFDLAAKKKVEVIGFYHSHPDHDAYWSEEDHRAAMWAGTDEPSFPDASHVVVSIYKGRVKEGAVFVWNQELGVFEKEATLEGE
ncbi:MAG: M67 family metallopeptidase [Nitrospinae bacterium]|nr:M67 family metallopeptidase [Nitrospinota bacterium]